MASFGRRGARGVSVARLRGWLLAGVLLLLSVLAVLVGYAHYRARRLLTDLPHRLGIDIKSVTDGFTLSQSSKGHTLFTLHAAKAIQRENGKTTLHDVAVTIYGPEGSNRTDSIRGAQFEYDQPKGIISAIGEVHLDLAAPAANTVQARPAAKRIEVTTSGLVFLQKRGIASTDQPIHIVYGDLRGGATGAEYESNSGILRLHSAVQMEGVEHGQNIHLHAGAAEMDRNAHVATLHEARLQADDNRAAGDTVMLALGANGGIDSVHGVGHTSVEGAGGMRAEAPLLDAKINNPANGPSHLQIAHMTGGVRLTDTDGGGVANDAVLHFTPAGTPELAEFTGSVRLNDRTPGGGTTQLNAGRVVAQLMQEKVAGAERTGLREATATAAAGDAVTLHSTDSVAVQGTAGTASAVRGSITRVTTVTAQTLHAVTSAAGGTRYISAIDGAGGTRIDQTDDAGNIRSSSGDTLQATLRSPVDRAAGSRSTTGTLRAATQTGLVAVTSHTAAKSGGAAAEDSHATAARADFDGSTQRLTLTGSPVVTGTGVQMAADRITLGSASAGGASQGASSEAEGNVRGTFVSTEKDGSDPVHVLAARAVTGGTTAAFFSTGGRPARMWTSQSQLEASEIHLDRVAGKLTATAAAGGQVHLTLPASTARSSTGASAVAVRIFGPSLSMTGATATVPGHAVMTGGVRLLSGDAQLSADAVNATLAGKESAPAANGAAAGALSGSVQSVLATGSVRMQQPGRTATGERLMYTAKDGKYDLTGTPSAPPHVVDSQRGNVVGGELIFGSADDSVEVVGEAGRRVRTETDAGAPPVRKR